MNNIKPLGERYIEVTAEKLEAMMNSTVAERMGLYSPRDIFCFWLRTVMDLAHGSVVRQVRIVEESPAIAPQEDAERVAGLSQAAEDGPEIPLLRAIAARVRYPQISEWGAN